MSGVTEARAPSVPRLTTVRLLAGRGAFRIAAQLMTVVVAAVWGSRNYAEFANAVGVCGWLVYLPTAAEKAALKLVPRGGPLAADLARQAFRTAMVPALLVTAVAVLGGLLVPGSPTVLYLLTAAWSTCTGALMALSGLHRLNGRPALDARAFGAAAVVVLVVTALTWSLGLSPSRHLGLLLIGVTPLLALSAAALPRPWRWGPARRRVGAVFTRSLLLMGVTDLLDAVALALLFVMLAATGRVAESGPFYLTVLPLSLLGSVVLYLLRVHQPAVSFRQRGSGAEAGRATAARLLGLVVRAGSAALAVGGVLLAVPAVRDAVASADGTGPAADAHRWAVLIVLGLVETVGYLAVTYATYLVENTTGAMLTRTAGAAVARLAVAVVAGLLLVGVAGAVGGFVALIVSLVAHAALLRRLIRRAAPSTGSPTTGPTVR